MPERTFEFGNPEGRGGSCSFGIPGERWVKECAFCCGGVDFFWNKPMQTYSVPVDSFKRGVMNVDHLRGHQDHLLMFVVFRLILICHLSGQEAFSVGSLTQDPSLICITGCTCIYVCIASFHLLQFTFQLQRGVDQKQICI